MPRKNEDFARQVLNILSVRGLLDGVEVQRLDGLDHRGVIDHLGRVQIFLSFASQEGFSMPLLEAMGSGALVVGFDGSGGAELLDQSTGFPVGFGDVVSFSSRVETAMNEIKTNPNFVQSIADEGRRRVLEHYSLEGERESVQRAWSRIKSRFEEQPNKHARGLVIPFDERSVELEELSTRNGVLEREVDDLRDEVVETHTRLFRTLEQVEDLERQITSLISREADSIDDRSRLVNEVQRREMILETVMASTSFRLGRRVVKFLSLDGRIRR
jgi:hypothetical protein